MQRYRTVHLEQIEHPRVRVFEPTQDGAEIGDNPVLGKPG